MHEVDHGEDVLCLASRDSFAVREKPASLVFNVMAMLGERGSTMSKGLKESPLALGVLR